MMTLQPVSGYILAGGASRRMGQPKQGLVLEDETMLERQSRLLRRVCRRVSVVGPPVGEGAPEMAFISDLLPGRGPLGGIHAALAASRTDFNLVVACDLPFLDARFLRGMIQQAVISGADVTIPEDPSRRLVPVCAVYRKRIQGIIHIRLREGLNKADGYFRGVRLCRIAWREILRAGFSPHIFDNINRPEDFDAARRRIPVVRIKTS